MSNPFMANNATPAPAQEAPATQASAPAQNTPAGFGTPSTPAGTPADPFGKPKGAGGDKISNDVENGLLVRPTEFVSQMRTSQGLSDAVRADWIVLTGPNAGQVRSNSLVFNSPLVRDLKAILDGPQKFLVGVLTRAAAKKPGDPESERTRAFIFADPNDEVLNLARQAAEAHNWV